jgi:hypothetical protein
LYSLEDFSVECDMVDVTMRHRPDVAWVHVDPNGHRHVWYLGNEPATNYRPTDTYVLPTLDLVVDVPGDDEHPAVTHRECKLCRARVDPGYCADDTRQFMPGFRRYYIKGEPVSARDFEAALKAVEEL